MRFDRITLPAYGPFTDLTLAFNKPATGDFHIVLGRNEAGKTNLLNAIHDFLFGIHAQTAADFVHAKPSLRIQAMLSSPSLGSIALERIKKNGPTLRQLESEDRLANTILAPWLGPVNTQSFHRQFGLSHKLLRDGADQIDACGGDWGELLISAKRGGIDLKSAIDSLLQRRESLFKKTRKKSLPYYGHTDEVEMAGKRLKDAQLSVRDWDSLIDERDRLEQEIQSIEAELLEQNTSLAKLVRMRNAQPLITDLDQLLESLSAYEGLPNTGASFTQETRSLLKERVTAGDAKLAQELQLKQYQDQLTGLELNESIINQASDIELAFAQAARIEAAREEEARLRREIDDAKASAIKNLKRLSLPTDAIDSIPEFEITREAEDALAETADTLLSLRKQLADKEADQEEVSVRLQKTDSETGPPEDLDWLPVLEEAQRAADWPERLNTYDQDIATRQQELQNGASRLPRSSGIPLASLITLPVPERSAISAAQTSMTDSKRDVQQARETIEDLQSTISEAQNELQSLEAKGVTVTGEDLLDARKQRTELWEQIYACWRKGDKEPDSKLPLDLAFPKAMHLADEMADRLQLHTEDAVQAAQLRSTIANNTLLVDKAEQRLAKALEAQAHKLDEWTALWAACGVSPDVPPVMSEWRDQWEDLVQESTALGAVQHERDRLQRDFSIIQNALQQALPMAKGEQEFCSLIQFGQTRRLDIESAKTLAAERAKQRAADETRLQDLELELIHLRKAVEEAEASWLTQLTDALLPASMPLKKLSAWIADRKTLQQNDSQTSADLHRADTLRSEVQAFEEQVTNLVGGDPTLSALPPSTAIQRLNNLREDQLKRQTQKENLLERIEERQSTLQTLQQTTERLDEAFASAMAHLQVETEAGLLAACEALDARDEIRRHVLDKEQAIERERGSEELADFCQACRDVDADMLAAEYESLTLKVASLTESQNEANQRLGAQKRDIEVQSEDSSTAAHAQADIEKAMTGIVDVATEVLQIDLAIRALQAMLDRSREDSNTPLLKQASAHFATITGGSFKGLEIDDVSQANPILTGVPREGKPIVPKEMSEGTRDQLYLALRLAAVQEHNEVHEPFPLILDDVLMTFDDERSVHALNTFAEMSAQSQVLMFTHHPHIVELCKKHLETGRFCVHQLGA